jgi:hypothetical protein
MLGNDTYGDCTFAGMGHIDIVTAFVLGQKQNPRVNTKEVLKEYLRFDDGKDVGADESVVLQDWYKKGWFGRKSGVYVPVRPTDYSTIKSLVVATGAVYLGVVIPQSAQTQTMNGKPWSVVEGSPIEGGHCVIIVGWDADFFYVITWGQVQAVTYAWMEKYMDEAWAVIAPEILIGGTFDGLDVAALTADLDAIPASSVAPSEDLSVI